MHKKERPFECPNCPNTFNRKDTLKIHVATVHEGQKSHNVQDFTETDHDGVDIDMNIKEESNSANDNYENEIHSEIDIKADWDLEEQPEEVLGI